MLVSVLRTADSNETVKRPLDAARTSPDNAPLTSFVGVPKRSVLYTAWNCSAAVSMYVNCQWVMACIKLPVNQHATITGREEGRTRLHGVTYQKETLFRFISVRTVGPTNHKVTSHEESHPWPHKGYHSSCLFCPSFSFFFGAYCHVRRRKTPIFRRTKPTLPLFQNNNDAYNRRRNVRIHVYKVYDLFCISHWKAQRVPITVAILSSSLTARGMGLRISEYVRSLRKQTWVFNLCSRWRSVVIFTPLAIVTSGGPSARTHRPEHWVGPRATLDAMEKEKIACLFWESNPLWTFTWYSLEAKKIRGHVCWSDQAFAY
jgi:hypothetical protein